MKPKFVFLDIDGTLVDKLETIHPSTVTAVELARRNGHKLFISSGRYKGIMPRCLAPLEFTDGVFAAGANVICGGKVIYNRTFSPENYDRIISALIRHGAFTVIESQLGDDADCTNEELQKELGDICNVVTMSYPDSSTGGEIMQAGVNKSVGIHKVLEHYGADVSDTIAIGDGANDIEMLDLCGIGVAMGNAAEIVKQHADIVTDRIENDGLYKAFNMLELI